MANTPLNHHMIHQGSVIKALIIGEQSVYTKPSILICLDNQKFLVNMGEGMQRLLVEHKVGISSINNLFITRPKWSHMGGMRGMPVCHSNDGSLPVKVFGDNQLKDMFSRLHAISNHPFENFDFNLFQICAKFVEVPNFHKFIRLKYYCTKDENNYLTSLIFDFSKICGSINVEKAKSLGIHVKQFSQLKNGLPVYVNDMKIESCELMSINDGPLVIVVESDHPQILDFVETLKREVDRKFSMLHISDYDVINHPNYKYLFQAFPSDDHFIITPETFSVHPMNIYPYFHNAYSNLKNVSPSLFSTYHWISGKEIDTEVPCPKNLSSIDLKTGLLKSTVYRNESNNEPIFENHPYALFLGTASTCPSKFRNVSSVLISFSDAEFGIFDCGESSLNQLFYAFDEGVDRVLSHLKFIFISHIHADHHLGLISLIKAVNRFNSITVICPREISHFLAEYKYIEHLNFIPIVHDDYVSNIQIKEITFQDSSITVKIFPVVHSVKAYGVVATHGNTKIIYSGDTTPCDNILKFGKDVDIFIHEATFDECLKAEAVKRKHTTIKEAIELGKNANAKLIILTHFSLRYHHFETLKFDSEPNVVFATDYMKVDFQNYMSYKNLENCILAISDID